MRHDAASPLMVEPALLTELAAYLQKTHSKLSPAQAVSEAIRRFSAGATSGNEHDDAAGYRAGEPGDNCRGYQWKTLFLPESTLLRMTCGDETRYAQVVGDAIMFEGRAVSPRGMTLAIAGEGRNAWRDLWLRLPGERYWKSAMSRRREYERCLARAPASPADLSHSAAALNEAAQAVSKALAAALALAANMAPLPLHDERRKGTLRRATDAMLDDCPFD